MSWENLQQYGGSNGCHLLTLVGTAGGLHPTSRHCGHSTPPTFPWHISGAGTLVLRSTVRPRQPVLSPSRVGTGSPCPSRTLVHVAPSMQQAQFLPHSQHPECRTQSHSQPLTPKSVAAWSPRGDPEYLSRSLKKGQSQPLDLSPYGCAQGQLWVRPEDKPLEGAGNLPAHQVLRKILKLTTQPASQGLLPIRLSHR